MLSPQAPDNPAYGFLWWLNGQRTHRLPGPMRMRTFAGPLIPSAPPDLVSALGRRSEEHTSELQSRQYLVCRLLLEKKKITQYRDVSQNQYRHVGDLDSRPMNSTYADFSYAGSCLKP